MRNHLLLVATLVAALTLAPAVLAAGGQKVTLMLDWTPKPDHVGLYDARETGLFARAGLDVAIRAPSDATAPLTHRVDAVLGVYRNVEGIQLELRGFHPTVVPVDRAGVPSYDELVLVANKTRLRDDSVYRSEVRRVVTAFLAGTIDARAHPARALAILKKVTASDPKFLARATPATLKLLSGPHGVGCLSLPAWKQFGAWMHARGLLKKAVPAASVVDLRFLPKRCR